MISRLQAVNTALFVCDVQGAFMKTIYGMNELINTTSFLMKSARVLGFPCIITEQYPERLQHTVELLQPLIQATELQKAFPIFPKVDFTMLSDEVTSYLQHNYPNVKNIILCGLETHVCVMQTCLDLLHNGYSVQLCVDAVSSRSPIDRKVAINRLQQTGVILTTSESIVFQMLGSKNHPNFREISSLVKGKELPQLLD